MEPLRMAPVILKLLQAQPCQ